MCQSIKYSNLICICEYLVVQCEKICMKCVWSEPEGEQFLSAVSQSGFTTVNSSKGCAQRQPLNDRSVPLFRFKTNTGMTRNTHLLFTLRHGGFHTNKHTHQNYAIPIHACHYQNYLLATRWLHPLALWGQTYHSVTNKLSCLLQAAVLLEDRY